MPRSPSNRSLSTAQIHDGDAGDLLAIDRGSEHRESESRSKVPRATDPSSHVENPAAFHGGLDISGIDRVEDELPIDPASMFSNAGRGA